MQIRRSFSLISIIFLIALMACTTTEPNPDPDPDPITEAPSNVVMTAEEGAIVVTWTDNSDNETGFVVFRAVATAVAQRNDDFVELSRTNPNENTYRDEAVDPAQGYRYAISALSDSGEVGERVLPTDDQPVSPLPAPQPPSTTGLEDVEVTAGDAAQSIELSDFFDDVQDGPEGLTYSLVSNSVDEVVSAQLTGSLLMLEFLEAGISLITVKATNSADLSVETSFSVTVLEEPNTAPIFAATANADAFEDVNFSYDFSASDPDEGDQLSFSAITLPDWLSLTDNGDATGSLTGLPGQEHVGGHLVELMVSDAEGLSDEASFIITVANTNDQPVVEDVELVTDEDQALSFTLLGSDEDGDNLTIITTQPNHGVLTGQGGDLTYTPDEHYFGTDSFNYIANDGNVDSEAGSVVIVVNSVNDPPYTQSDFGDVRVEVGAFNQITNLTTVFLDIDDGGQNLIFTATNSNPEVVTIDIVGFLMTLNFPAAGVSDVLITATDSAGASVSSGFQVIVSEPDTPESSD